MASTEPPRVPRFNAWREWKPILANMEMKAYLAIQEEVRAIDGPEVKAAYAYCKYTGFDGIEFVILANFVDAAPVRRYPGGLIVVPCDDVLSAKSGSAPFMTVPRGEHLYDAWIPVAAVTPAEIRDTLAEIDDTVTFIARAYGVAARWVPKYVDTMSPPVTYADVNDEDWERHTGGLARLKSLPRSVRPAVSRAAHWLLRGQAQRGALDRFLFMWFGFEGLLLTLYDHAGDVELPLENEDAGRSKSQRRAAQNERIRQIIAASLESDPTQAAMQAYFDGVISIRRRSEAVLRAALGAESALVTWPYTGSTSPSQLRTDVVHNGKSAREIYERFPVERIAEQLEHLTNELIIRTLRRAWRGASLPTHSQSMIMPIRLDMMNAPGGGPVVQGDFRITHQLLAMKGLL